MTQTHLASLSSLKTGVVCGLSLFLMMRNPRKRRSLSAWSRFMRCTLSQLTSEGRTLKTQPISDYNSKCFAFCVKTYLTASPSTLNPLSACLFSRSSKSFGSVSLTQSGASLSGAPFTYTEKLLSP